MYIQSSQPNRQVVKTVRESMRAPTTMTETTSNIMLHAMRLGALLTASWKLGVTPAGGGPAGTMFSLMLSPVLSVQCSKKH